MIIHGTASVRPRFVPTLFTILAILILMGCGRSGTDTEVMEGEPNFPVPSDPIEVPDEVDEAVEEISTNLADCSQYWHAQSLYQMLLSSFYYGSYDPFVPAYAYPYSYLSDRGFRGAGTRGRGLSCANDLMSAASFLQSQAQYYGHGEIQTWLGGMVGWAYGMPSNVGVGYANGQWGGYDPSAWVGSPWTR